MNGAAHASSAPVALFDAATLASIRQKLLSRAASAANDGLLRGEDVARVLLVDNIAGRAIFWVSFCGAVLHLQCIPLFVDTHEPIAGDVFHATLQCRMLIAQGVIAPAAATDVSTIDGFFRVLSGPPTQNEAKTQQLPVVMLADFMVPSRDPVAVAGAANVRREYDQTHPRVKQAAASPSSSSSSPSPSSSSLEHVTPERLFVSPAEDGQNRLLLERVHPPAFVNPPGSGGGERPGERGTVAAASTTASDGAGAGAAAAGGDSGSEELLVYDMVVVGAGAGGLVTASGCVRHGAKVALVEYNLMGGDCLNIGCVPSKASDDPLMRCLERPLCILSGHFDPSV